MFINKPLFTNIERDFCSNALGFHSVYAMLLLETCQSWSTNPRHSELLPKHSISKQAKQKVQDFATPLSVEDEITNARRMRQFNSNQMLRWYIIIVRGAF